ncbi:sensor histidine kinase [Bradyrhizobium sp. MOS002]|uniref:sensor histidine kinase n=1 Tax=Bradyrhizobium sp. MOS002 TaxID=2133947 RepID=UPI000D123B1F|nr:sensor histidine kinase [Bradyrhizobium sp. MOS002]PSO17519.1 ATPase [Bradyrhizobium sp. MOS002]
MAASRTPRRLVYMWVAAVVVLLVSIGGTTAQSKSGETAAKPKTILLLRSYGQNFEPWAVWGKEICDEMVRQSPWPLDIQDHSIVTARNGDTATEAKFVEYLGALYAQSPPDLIVSLGGPAARFVQQHRPDLFPTTPMLLASVDVLRIEPSMLSEQDAVVALRNDHVAVIENILRLLPETKTIAMIIGNSPAERLWIGDLQQELKRLIEKNKVELIFYNERPFAEILKAVAKLPPHSAILFQQLMVDGAGAVYGDKNPIKRISEVANAPIFKINTPLGRDVAVGGPMFSPAEAARPTAAVAVRMLGGEKGSDIRVPPIELPAPKYDWRQLERWNISESRLPPGSEVLFREPTAWQRYSWQIALTLAVILVQAGLISALLSQRRGRYLAEMQARQRMKELAHVNRFSTAGELTATIAHEINQPLGSVLTNAETAQAILKSSNPDIVELNEIVDDIVRDNRRASDVVRKIRDVMKRAPFDPKNLDFNEVVRDAVEFLSAVGVGRKVELKTFLAPAALPIIGDRIQLQQVVTNLVVNAMDAMADVPGENRIVSIRTSRVEKFAQLSVSDRGHGIPEDKLKEVFEPFYTSKAEGMGMGLSIARTIIEAHNGHISARNRDHGGATFRIRLPLVG